MQQQRLCIPEGDICAIVIDFPTQETGEVSFLDVLISVPGKAKSRLLRTIAALQKAPVHLVEGLVGWVWRQIFAPSAMNVPSPNMLVPGLLGAESIEAALTPALTRVFCVALLMPEAWLFNCHHLAEQLRKLVEGLSYFVGTEPLALMTWLSGSDSLALQGPISWESGNFPRDCSLGHPAAMLPPLLCFEARLLVVSPAGIALVGRVRAIAVVHCRRSHRLSGFRKKARASDNRLMARGTCVVRLVRI